MQDSAADFGRKFHLVLEVLNYSRVRCAHELGVHKSNVARWAAGAVMPTEHNLSRLTELVRRVRPGFSAATWRLETDDFARSLQPTLPIVKQSIHDRPAIAVLAFDNLSGDREQDYFSDGMASDIITELSHDRSLFVIARNSSFTFKGRAVDVRRVARELGVRYVLEGSARRDGGQVRVNAQLIDAETGNNIWAERYDRSISCVFGVQDEITAAVVRAILPAVADAERRRVVRKHTEDLGAWEAYQRGIWHLARLGTDENERAKAFFRRAIELDPMLSAAYVSMAIAMTYDVAVYGTALADDTFVAEAGNWARKAIFIDAGDADALAALGWVVGGGGARDEAWRLLSQALTLCPNSSFVNGIAGIHLVWFGQPAHGRALLESGLRINPRDPVNIFFENVIVVSRYFERDYLGAVEGAKRSIADSPAYPPSYRWLAAALGQLGRRDEAHEALRQAYAISAKSVEFYTRARPRYFQITDYEHFLEGLRKAGWEV